MNRFTKILKTAIAIVVVLLSIDAAAQDPSIIVQERPMYEKLGMTPTQLFSVMAIITLILVGFVVSLAGSARNILEYKKSKTNNGSKIILVLIGLGISSSGFSAANEPMYDYVFSFPDTAFWAFVALDIALVMIIMYLTGIIKGVISEYSVPTKINIFAKWNKRITDAVPLEDEASILLDHDYDGIKELDNNLPPWWKYGFYITIVWSVGYLLYYQVFEIGNLQEAEYIAEMEAGDRADAAYREAHPEMITADNVTLMEDASTLAKGKDIYVMYCQTCHLEGGKGGIGPNLTDKYWIYDGDIKGVFTTISEGAQNGMIAWKDMLPANEIQAVSSYILKLDLVEPPNGKAPQGDRIFE